MLKRKKWRERGKVAAKKRARMHKKHQGVIIIDPAHTHTHSHTHMRTGIHTHARGSVVYAQWLKRFRATGCGFNPRPYHQRLFTPSAHARRQPLPVWRCTVRYFYELNSSPMAASVESKFFCSNCSTPVDVFEMVCWNKNYLDLGKAIQGLELRLHNNIKGQ